MRQNLSKSFEQLLRAQLGLVSDKRQEDHVEHWKGSKKISGIHCFHLQCVLILVISFQTPHRKAEIPWWFSSSNVSRFTLEVLLQVLCMDAHVTIQVTRLKLKNWVQSPCTITRPKRSIQQQSTFVKGFTCLWRRTIPALNPQNNHTLDRGSIRSSLRDGLSTPYRMTKEQCWTVALCPYPHCIEDLLIIVQ